MSNFLSNSTQSNSLVHEHGDQQFKPNTTVAAVVHHQGKFLFVEEIEDNQRVLNQPAGHLEAGENLVDAAKRELLEETGIAANPNYLSGIYYYHRSELEPQLYFLRFCFVFELTSQVICTPQDSDIIDTHWLTFEQLKQQNIKHRSTMVLQCVEDYLAGKKIPLGMLQTNL